jgi:CubicO group peptidase (beta-lactamase class C family)
MIPTCFLAWLPALFAHSTLPVTQGELVVEAEQLVREAAARDEFSGTVLIARDGEVLLELAVGEASKRFHVPNQVDTKFNLGSMNKMFTCVAAAQLVEKGALSFDDPISKYLDESWLPPEITERITVRHLATHTSGLGSYFNQTYQQSSRALFRAVDDYKPLVRDETLAFEPGEGWGYSNTGMLLLGAVIEQAAGQDYFEYIDEHVYAPAGMASSGCYEMDQPVENLAIGYDRDPQSAQGWRNNVYMHVLRGGPAGGGFSTVGDLNRFATALLEGKLAGVSSLDTLWSDHAGRNYGYGFSVEDGVSGKVVGHSGGFPGISSNLDIHIDRGFVVAVMSNYSGGMQVVRPGLRALVERVD